MFCAYFSRYFLSNKWAGETDWLRKVKEKLIKVNWFLPIFPLFKNHKVNLSALQNKKEIKVWGQSLGSANLIRPVNVNLRPLKHSSVWIKDPNFIYITTTEKISLLNNVNTLGVPFCFLGCGRCILGIVLLLVGGKLLFKMVVSGFVASGLGFPFSLSPW